MKQGENLNLSWINDQLFECLNQLQRIAFTLSGFAVQSENEEQSLMFKETEQYLDKYITRVNKEIRRVQALMLDSKSSRRNSRQHHQENHKQQDFRQTQQQQVQEKHKNSIQTLSNRKNSLQSSQKAYEQNDLRTNQKHIQVQQENHMSHFSSISPLTQRQTLSIENHEDGQDDDFKHDLIKRESQSKNKRRTKEERTQGSRNSYDQLYQDGANFKNRSQNQNNQSIGKTRNQQLDNQHPYSVEDKINYNPVKNQPIEDSRKQHSQQEFLVSPIFEKARSSTTESQGKTLIRPKSYRSSIQAKPKYHELPLQIPSPANLKFSALDKPELRSSSHQQHFPKFGQVNDQLGQQMRVHSNSQSIQGIDHQRYLTLESAERFQRQVELYEQEKERLNSQISEEKQRFENMQRQSQNIDPNRAEKRRSKSKKKQSRESLFKGESQTERQGYQTQRIQDKELDIDKVIRREQRLKEKYRAQKEKFQVKISEYKLYIESIKVKNQRLQSTLDNLYLNDSSEFIKQCMQMLRKDIDPNCSNYENQEIILQAISLLISGDILHQEIIENQREEINNLLENQEQFSLKIRDLENILSKKSESMGSFQKIKPDLGKSNLIQHNVELSQKTLALTERFDKLKNEIRKVQEQKRNLETVSVSPNRLDASHEPDLTKSPIIEDRLRQLNEREKQLKEREDIIKQTEQQQLQTMRQSLQQVTFEQIRTSIDKERLESFERSEKKQQNTINNLQDKFEGLQQKLSSQNFDSSHKLKSDIEEIKAQLKELKDFKTKQQHFSPVPIKKKHERFRSLNSKEPLTQQSIEEQLRTKGFKLSTKPGFVVDSSSNFDSLHDVCNHQIDELKKTIRMLCQEKEETLEVLEDQRDQFQQVVNEKMELEILYSSKLNEIAYLHRYLDESEFEIRQLKQALDDQFQQMKNENEQLELRVRKYKDKTKMLREKIDLKDLQQHQLLMMSSKDNSSIYQGERHMGTPGLPKSQNQSLLNENLPRVGRVQVESCLGHSVQGSNQKQLLIPSQSLNRNQNSQSQQNLQLNTVIRNNHAGSLFSKNSTVLNSPSRNQSLPRPIRTLTIDVPLDDYDNPQPSQRASNEDEKIILHSLKPCQNQQNWFQQSLLDQANNQQHFYLGLDTGNQNHRQRSTESLEGLQFQTMNFNCNQQQSAKFLTQPVLSLKNASQSLDSSKSLDNRIITNEEMKVIQYEEMPYQSQRSGYQPSQPHNEQQIRIDSNTNSQYFDGSNLITPTSYVMMQYHQQQLLREPSLNLEAVRVNEPTAFQASTYHSTHDERVQIEADEPNYSELMQKGINYNEYAQQSNDSIDISNTFKPSNSESNRRGQNSLIQNLKSKNNLQKSALQASDNNQARDSEQLLESEDQQLILSQGSLLSSEL